MPQTQPDLPYVIANMAYTAPLDGPAQVRVFPPSSGRDIEVPKHERHEMPIYDCRQIMDDLSLDVAGFALRKQATAFTDFYNAERVRAEYYPEIISLLKDTLGAQAVFIFDHNVRSQVRSDAKQPGVRMPVDGAHNDYTENSGPRRTLEILADNNASELSGHRAALINAWRPIVEPIQDFPLAVCDARSVVEKDFIPTTIQHFLEDDLEQPHLTGEIYSVQHNPDHRWYYLADMKIDEVMLLKCYDSANDGRAMWTAHTGFKNPDCPPDFVPRESIEVRTLVIFPTQD